MKFISNFVYIIALIVFIYCIYSGFKWFKYRHHSGLKHHYKKCFWISLAAYLVIATIIGGMSPSGSSHQASHSAKPVAYRNTGNAKENFSYFKNHAVHKFADYSADHPYKPDDGPEDMTSANSAHWSNSDGAFVIDTDADPHSDADKHVQAEACFHQFKKFINKYEPMSNPNWDGSVVFQDVYGGEITTGDINYKHLSENGMGFDD